MKKGEKYIIEIAEVHTHYDDNGKAYPMARIKGFSALTFDEKGLSKLERVEDNKPVEYLNCRFVVTSAKNTIVKVGDIYEVKSGCFIVNGISYPKHKHLQCFDELVSYFNWGFTIMPVRVALLED